MADTRFVKKNRLGVEARGSDYRGPLFLAGFALFAVLTYAVPQLFLIWLALLAGFVLVALLGDGLDRIKESGAKGEDEALKALSALPDSYTIFNQIYIPNERGKNGRTELDLVVVGPNGIFVVEVKNIRGEVEGSRQDWKWIVHKVGRQGSNYTSEISNPVKQLGRQIGALKPLVRRKEDSPWVQGIAFFPNPDHSVKLRDDPGIPVLTNMEDLIKYIQEFNPKYKPRNPGRIVQDLARIDNQEAGEGRG